MSDQALITIPEVNELKNVNEILLTSFKTIMEISQIVESDDNNEQKIEKIKNSYKKITERNDFNNYIDNISRYDSLMKTVENMVNGVGKKMRMCSTIENNEKVEELRREAEKKVKDIKENSNITNSTSENAKTINVEQSTVKAVANPKTSKTKTKASPAPVSVDPIDKFNFGGSISAKTMKIFKSFFIGKRIHMIFDVSQFTEDDIYQSSESFLTAFATHFSSIIDDKNILVFECPGNKKIEKKIITGMKIYSINGEYFTGKAFSDKNGIEFNPKAKDSYKQTALYSELIKQGVKDEDCNNYLVKENNEEGEIITVPRNCALEKTQQKDSSVKVDENINSDEIVDDSFNPSV